MEGLSKPSPGTLGIVYFLTRSSKIISPGQTPLVLLTLGSGETRLGSGLGGMRPSHQRATEPSSTGSPKAGTAHLSTPPGAGQGREARPCGKRCKGNAPLRRAGWKPLLSDPPSPPEAAHTNPLQNCRYGLEVAARFAKGAWVHPPAFDHGRDTLLQKAFLPKRYPK